MPAVSPCRKASKTLNSLTDCSIEVVDGGGTVEMEPLRGTGGDLAAGEAEADSGLVLVMVVTR
jgi:hypothetical protein